MGQTEEKRAEAGRPAEDQAAVDRFAGRRWWLANTSGHAEKLARFHLQQRGFEVYLPLKAVAKRSEGTVTPLFPRYLFVAVPDQPRWHEVRASIGVVSLVRAAGADHPIEVGGRLVSAIKAREVLGLVVLDDGKRSGAAAHGFTRGDRLKVTGGAFAGFEVLFERQSDADRVLVLLTMCTGKMRLHVAASDLKAVG